MYHIKVEKHNDPIKYAGWAPDREYEQSFDYFTSKREAVRWIAEETGLPQRMFNLNARGDTTIYYDNHNVRVFVTYE